MSRLNAEFLKEFIVDETPTGTVNGSNADFVLSEVPFDPQDGVQVFIDGLKDDAFILTGTTITMTTAPALGQSIRVHYFMKAGEN